MPLKLIFISLCLITTMIQASTTNKKLIYMTSDINIPFWQIMSKGINSTSNSLGYDFEIYSADNSAKQELANTIKAIRNKVAGIIVSPTNSSACVTILKLAKKANIPVVIADIGTDSGEYVSYVSSNNKNGAYNIGKLLAKQMKALSYDKGTVGIIAIPQKRLNGQERTAGFMKALDEEKIKSADIKQLSKWTQEETYNYVKDMIEKYPNLKAIWLQTSNFYKAAINAINDSGKSNEVLLISFDAEPVFLDLIPKGDIIGAAMQQPYLMGQEAVIALDKHLKNEKVAKHIQLPILSISKENIEAELSTIKRNVLGIENK
ncbi:substrate-binding domain-containing protein [Poseidonibacter lekithochrous]|uniref:substrate-binding domain-containing protein n=1 Tax=Poseidonibacter lekithochrous TaxID=1904463 RepID=UPI0008FC56C7|nr:substrate-binding domain-containing protein [Poseidonibacter lekithochrous]QKJ22955.1 ABC transporter, periplasmic substrate-binding protein [Poseidonibacter lekithochrous]